jgi:hypothetical protein
MSSMPSMSSIRAEPSSLAYIKEKTRRVCKRGLDSHSSSQNSPKTVSSSLPMRSRCLKVEVGNNNL